MLTRGEEVLWANAAAISLFGLTLDHLRDGRQLLSRRQGLAEIFTSDGPVPVEALEHRLDGGTVLTLLVDQRRQRSLHAEVAQSRHALGIVSRLVQPEHLGPIEGMNLAFWVHPVGPLGGDFVDLVPLDAGRHAIVLGDAVGSGAEAWTLAVVARSFLRACLWTAESVTEAVERANGLLCREFSLNRFVSALVVLIDPKRLLTIVCAGYPPPLLLRSGGSSPLQVQENVPLGLDPHRTFLAQQVELGERDCIIFYSDGLSEHRRSGGDFFGAEGILRAASEATGPALQAIRGAARQFDHEFIDDVTLVTLDVQSQVHPTLTLHFPPDAQRIRGVRRAFEAAAKRAKLSPGALSDFAVAIGEALNNAVLHGTVPGQDNTIEARYWEEQAAIGVQVRSPATGWKLSPDDARSPARGIALMRALADQVMIEQDPNGTTVTLYKKHRQ